jgi:GMP synthase-like glutamine amidotransferase
MTPLLFVRFDDDDTFGVGPDAVTAEGATVLVWNAGDPEDARPSLDDVAGVVVFGSVDNVEHADEKPHIKEAAELMREAVDRGLPTLGACFGGQLLAWSLDAGVTRGPVRELGFEPIHPTPAAADDPLFSHLRDGDRAFQWHMDTFAVPERAELLAIGEHVANQAFRFGDRAWGTQFHFEVDRAEVELWLEEFSATGDLEREWGKPPEVVRAELDRHVAGHEARGREIFRRFARIAARP